MQNKKIYKVFEVTVVISYPNGRPFETGVLVAFYTFSDYVVSERERKQKTLLDLKSILPSSSHAKYVRSKTLCKGK